MEVMIGDDKKRYLTVTLIYAIISTLRRQLITQPLKSRKAIKWGAMKHQP
jgi:hypothetical protein